MTRHRVLLIAEAANPEWASVPLVGWSLARALFELADVHLVTQIRNSAAIERARFKEGREFTALDSENVARPLYQANEAIRKATGLGWTFEMAMQVLPYYYFEHLLWQRFGPEIEAKRWDVVHRVTPLSPTVPSLVARRCQRAGVPFVWGPINGGIPWPPGFGGAQRREGEWLHYVRDAYRLLPAYRETRNSASAIISGSVATFMQLPDRIHGRTVYVPENAIDEGRFEARVKGPVELPLRVAFVGRLVPYKGADMLIEAASELARAGKLLIDIIGDGPERQNLIALCERLGLSVSSSAPAEPPASTAERGSAMVRLEGWVEHKQLAARLGESDVFGFPSVREFGGAVVLEAMALGLVPLIADYGGPAEHVTERTGFRVPMGSREQLIAGFRRALEGLVSDPSQLRALGAEGQKRVREHYTWKAKAQQMLEVYGWVRGQREKPDFGMPFPDLGPAAQDVGAVRESLLAGRESA